MINIDCVTSKLDGFSRGFPVQDDGVPLRGRGRGLQVQLEPWRCRNQSLISQTPKAGSSLVEGFLCTPEKNVYSWCSFLGMYLTYIGISKRPCRHPESYETTIYKFNICSIMFNRYFIYLYYNGPRAKKNRKSQVAQADHVILQPWRWGRDLSPLPYRQNVPKAVRWKLKCCMV